MPLPVKNRTLHLFRTARTNEEPSCLGGSLARTLLNCQLLKKSPVNQRNTSPLCHASYRTNALQKYCTILPQVSPRNNSQAIHQKQYLHGDHLRSENGYGNSTRRNHPPLSPPVSPRRSALELDPGYTYPWAAIIGEKTSVMRALLLAVALCAVVAPCMYLNGGVAGSREGGVRGGFADYGHDSNDAVRTTATVDEVSVQGQGGLGSLRGADAPRRSALETLTASRETDHYFLRGSISGSKSSEVLLSDGEGLLATEQDPTQDQPVAASVRVRGSTKIDDSPSTTQQLEQPGSAVTSNDEGSDATNDERSRGSSNNSDDGNKNDNSTNLGELGERITTTAVGAAVKCDGRRTGNGSSLEAENNQEQDEDRHWLVAVHIDRGATSDSGNSIVQMGRHLRGYQWYQQRQQQQLLEQRGLLPHEYFVRVVEAALDGIADIESGASVDVLVVSEGMRFGEDGGVEVLVDEVGMPVEDWDVPAALCKGLGLMCTQVRRRFGVVDGSRPSRHPGACIFFLGQEASQASCTRLWPEGLCITHLVVIQYLHG